MLRIGDLGLKSSPVGFTGKRPQYNFDPRHITNGVGPYSSLAKTLDALYGVSKGSPRQDVIDYLQQQKNLQQQKQECFPSATPIEMGDSGIRSICDVRVGDVVLAFDQNAEFGRGALVTRRVVRLFRNVTTEWLRLTWKETGEQRELVCTPGHHFLDQFGNFPPIEQLITAGRATVVLASGELVEVSAERIVYSADTADLFERAEVHGQVAGNALQLLEVEGWQTYNFEVEELHTYIAGGVRVHNISATWAHDEERAIAKTLDALLVGKVPLDYAISLGQATRGVDEDRRTGQFVGFTTAGRAIPLDRTVYNTLLAEHGGENASARDRAEVAARTAISNGQSRAAARAVAYGEAQRWGLDTYEGFDQVIDRAMREQAASRAKTGVQSPGASGKGGSAPSPSQPSGSSGKGGGGDGQSENSRSSSRSGSSSGSSGKPILLDLAGDGLTIDKLSESSQFIDFDGDDYRRRTAWAGKGDGVLILDANGDGVITRSSEFVFTDWDPSASGDLEAVKNAFDTNRNGQLDAGDKRWNEFKVSINGQLKSLKDLGIASIDLTPTGSGQSFSDGSAIVGTTTFTRSDGTKGLVGDAILANDENDYKIARSTTKNADGTSSELIVGYAKDGSVAFRNLVTKSIDGSTVTTKFDDDGDGIFDRSQSKTISIEPSGNRIETVKNFNADGSLSVSEKIDRSSDGLKITTTLDKNGDGSADERQLFQKFADSSSRTTTQQLHLDGAASKTVIINVSADGLRKTTSTDLTGDGVADNSVSDIKTPGKVAQERLVTEHARSGAMLARKTITTTSNAGIVTTFTDNDLNGDGRRDRGIEERTSTNSAGDVVTERTTYSSDKAVLKKEVFRISADGRSKFSSTDADGDGKNDTFTSDIIALDASGAWVQTKTARSAAGPLLSRWIVRIQPDRKNITETFDKNGDDVVDTSLITIVAPDSATTRTETHFNTDRSIVSRSSTVTSSNGYATTVTNDANGDGVVESKVLTTKTVASDKSSTVSTRTLTGNDKLVSQTISTTSADAMNRNVAEDLDGDGVTDRRTSDTVVLNSDGSRRKTVTIQSRNSSLIGRTTTDIAADRRTTTITIDSNGDGVVDKTTTESTLLDGQTIVEEKLFTRSGQAYQSSRKTTSANGLKTTVATDANGNGVADFTTITETLVNDDGSRSETVKNTSGDGRVFTSSATTTSGDGLTIISEQDLNGNGKMDARAVTSSSYDAKGAVSKSESNYRGNKLVSKEEIVTSGNGLNTVVSRDIDGDGDVDRVLTSVRILDANGSTSDQEQLKAGDGKLLSKTATAISADQKIKRTEADTDADGIVDSRTVAAIGANGVETQTNERLSRTGTLTSRHVSEVSANGFSSSWRTDIDGDGTVDLSGTETTTISADGSQTKTVSQTRSSDGLSVGETTSISASGLTKRIAWSEGASTKKTQLNVKVLESDGTATETTSITKADGTLASREVRRESTHGLVSTLSRDVNGDGKIDQEITRILQASGNIEQKYKDFNGDGGVTGTKTVNSRTDGTREVVEYDFNGDGVLDKAVHSDTIIGNDGKKSIWSVDYVMSESGWQRTNRWVTYKDADGLYTLTDFDIGGDFSKDYFTTDLTKLEGNGDSLRTIEVCRSGMVDSRRVTRTSGDGLSITTLLDLTGSGKSEQTSIDVTAHAPDGTLHRKILSTKSDGSLLSDLTTITAANGQRSETVERRAGLASRKIVLSSNLMADGSITQETAKFTTDNQLLGKTTVTVSADKRQKTTIIDSDGDGSINQKREETQAWWGEKTSVTTNFGPNGAVLQRIVSVTASDDLSSITTWDLNSDGTLDQKRVETKKLNADGSRFSIQTDTDLITGKTKSVSTDRMRADGRLRTISKDFDGDGVFDQIETVETLITGQTKSKITNNATARDSKYLPSGVIVWKNATAYSVESESSFDGSKRTSRYDYDGDGRFETVMTSRTQVDGSVVSDVLEMGKYGDPEAEGSIFTSADGQTIILSEVTDYFREVVQRRYTSVVGDDGSIILKTEDLDEDGSVLDTVVDTVNSVGTLTSRIERDAVGRKTRQFLTVFDGTSQTTTFDAASGGITGVSKASSSGILISATLYDPSNSKEWTRVEQTYDTKGRKTAEKQFLDNGTSVTIAFVAETSAQQRSDYFDESGLRTRSVEFDVLNNQPWREVHRFYDAHGNTLTLVDLQDAGSKFEYTYDIANTQGWSRYINQTDSSGRHIYAHQLNDDGTASAMTLDPSNVQPWWKIEQAFDSAGQITYQMEYLDDRNKTEIVYDAANNQAWRLFFNLYDSSGNYYYTQRQNDDGSFVFIEVDVYDTRRSWRRDERGRDSSGRTTYIDVVNDSGTRDVTFYDAAGNQWWERMEQTFDSEGRLTREVYLHDDGYWYDPYFQPEQHQGFHESDQDMSPVVIDLNNDGHIDLRPLDTSSLIAVKKPSVYDWNSDGVRDVTAWVGPQDGFLALDLGADGSSGPDGLINQAKELAFTLWPTEEQGSTNSDLEAVRLVFDTNQDGLLSAEDARWSEFRVWQDINQNGVSEGGELSTLDQLGIKYINLIPTPDGARDFMDGSAITGTSFLEKLDGKTQLVGDVRLAYRSSPAFA